MSTSGLTAANIANAFDVNFIYARQLFQSVDKDSTLEDVQKLINAKPKPFVKWVGGKRQLLKQFRVFRSITEKCQAFRSKQRARNHL